MMLLTVCLFLLFSSCLPPVRGCSDSILLPKWYLAVLTTLTAVTVYAWRKSGRVCGGNNAAAGNVDALPVAALLVLAYNLVYALVTDVLMPGVYDIHWVYLRGVFDNTTGFALNICLLTALSLPLTVEERRPVWLRRVAYAVLLLAACAVFISGCRAGMLCVALMAGMLLAHVICRRWLLWTIAGVILLAVSSLAMNMKNESTDGRRFILERTWELILQKPFTGYGWHGFEREYMPSQAEYFKAHPDDGAAWLADDISHPLNEFLYLWVCFGVTGPIILMLMLAVPMYFEIRKTKEEERSTWNVKSVMAVLAVFCLTGYPHLYPLSWFCLLLVYARMLHRWVMKRGTGRAAAIILTAASMACMVYIVNEIRHDHEWYLLGRDVRCGHSASALGGYHRLYPHYRHDSRFLYSMMFCQYQARQFCDAADTYGELSRLCRTYDMELLMGDVLRQDHRPWRALPHYELAHYMVPVRFAPLAGMMEAYGMMGDTLRADSVAHIILSKPVKVPSVEVDSISAGAMGRISR